MTNTNIKATGETLTLKKLERAYEKAKEFNQPRLWYFKRTNPLVWFVQKLMFWKYEQISPNMLREK